MNFGPTRLGLFVATVCAVVASGSINGFAQHRYSPDDPEVREMVERGIEFISTSQYREIGAMCMHAIAICEANKRYHGEIPLDHPLVSLAVTQAARYTLDDNGETTDNNTLYEPAVASILLGIVDPELYSPNIQATLRLLENRQIPSGAWKYKIEAHPPNLGDTSQTQYCCLAIWMASRSGHQISADVVERALDWLTQTQTDAGGWVYRATAGQPAGGGETLSITAAGAGAVLMLLDAVGAKSGFGSKGARRAGPEFPPFVTLYTPEADDSQGEEVENRRANVDTAAVSQVLSSANQYFGQNFTPNPPQWTYYYLYGFERYAYFREQLDGEVREVPDWYDQGVEFLKAQQRADGSWKSMADNEQGVVDSITTAFAVLFLVRSTELLANDPGRGPLYGGEALPKGKISQRGSKLYAEQLNREVTDFLDMVAKGDDNIEEFASSLTKIVLPEDPAKREMYMNQLRVLIKDPDAYKRLIAVKALATSRDMSNVPALLTALEDNEVKIKLAAHQGLRFISRKMDSIKLPENPSEGDFQAALLQWTDWYNTIQSRKK